MIVKIEHFGRTLRPGLTPFAHHGFEFFSLFTRREFGGQLHFLGQDNRCARCQSGAHGVDFLEADNDAALGRYETEAFAVNPDTVACFSTQTVHGIGVVECIGYTAVFLKIKATGNFGLDEIDTLGRFQIINDLFVAWALSCHAGKFIDRLKRIVFFEEEKFSTFLVNSHKMRWQTGRFEIGAPVFGPRHRGKEEKAGGGKQDFAKGTRQERQPRVASA